MFHVCGDERSLGGMFRYVVHLHAMQIFEAKRRQAYFISCNIPNSVARCFISLAQKLASPPPAPRVECKPYPHLSSPPTTPHRDTAAAVEHTIRVECLQQPLLSTLGEPRGAGSGCSEPLKLARVEWGRWGWSGVVGGEDDPGREENKMQEAHGGVALATLAPPQVRNR